MGTMTREEAVRILARHYGSQVVEQTKGEEIAEWSRKRYYIPETKRPLVMMPHQRSIIEYALDPDKPFCQGGTVIYSTIKKSGKTAISAAVARWVAETWGNANEIYCVANDREQARGRAYQKIIDSIELDPSYDPKATEKGGNGWKIIERQAEYVPNGSTVKALSSDYRSEAGSNPTMTTWTELWGYTSQASRRLWEELTPVPTRKRSVRWVETYAGFSDESDLLLDLYYLGQEGRRLTHDDIDWPFADQPPIWVNERARLFMYWDSGEQARRMPWQTPEYYATQAATLRSASYERLHLNLWTSSTGAFLPLEWWESCRVRLPVLTEKEAVVMGVDAGVSSDCTALVLVSRNPERPIDPLLRYYKVWYPPHGGVIDFNEIDHEIRDLCARYNVVEVTYDAYQLHKLMQDLRRDAVAWCKPFSQNTQREIADKQLFDVIRDRALGHNAGPEFAEHILAAAAKTMAQEDTRLRIVKKIDSKKIDLLIALSMAVYECLRLNLE